MQGKLIKRIILVVLAGLVLMAAIMAIKRAIPYKDSAELLSADISIDSVSIVGPTVVIYDKASAKYYWLKSLNSMDMSAFDSLKSKSASIRYMKFLMGPLENRIFHLEVDSVVVIDQTVE